MVLLDLSITFYCRLQNTPGQNSAHNEFKVQFCTGLRDTYVIINSKYYSMNVQDNQLDHLTIILLKVSIKDQSLAQYLFKLYTSSFCDICCTHTWNLCFMWMINKCMSFKASSFNPYVQVSHLNKCMLDIRA